MQYKKETMNPYALLEAARPQIIRWLRSGKSCASVQIASPSYYWLMYYDLKVRLLYARLEPWGA